MMGKFFKVFFSGLGQRIRIDLAIVWRLLRPRLGNIQRCRQHIELDEFTLVPTIVKLKLVHSNVEKNDGF